MNKILTFLTNQIHRRLGSFADIHNDYGHYVTRFYIINSDYFSVVLHQFWAPDNRGVHCHPWKNISIILTGGYKEVFHDNTFRYMLPGNWSYRQALVMHRIDKLCSDPGKTWTMFITFKRKRKWGFLNEDVKWNEINSRTNDGLKGVFLPRRK